MSCKQGHCGINCAYCANIQYMCWLQRQQIEILCLNLTNSRVLSFCLLRFVNRIEKLFYPKKLYWYSKFQSFHLKGTNKQQLLHWDLVHSSKIVSANTLFSVQLSLDPIMRRQQKKLRETIYCFLLLSSHFFPFYTSIFFHIMNHKQKALELG